MKTLFHLWQRMPVVGSTLRYGVRRPGAAFDGATRLAASAFIGALILCASAPLANAAPETRMLAGTLTNTTYDVTAPVTFELVLDGGKITGWMVTQPPLNAGRWPIEGTLKGAWCEFTCKQSVDTQTQFRGALSATDFRGTYVFGGKGEMIQYGRFNVKVSAAK